SRREDSDPAPFLREAVPGDAGPDRVKPHSPPLSTLTLGLVYRNISVGSLRELAPLPASCPPAKGASPQISTLIRYLRCYRSMSMSPSRSMSMSSSSSATMTAAPGQLFRLLVSMHCSGELRTVPLLLTGSVADACCGCTNIQSPP